MKCICTKDVRYGVHPVTGEFSLSVDTGPLYYSKDSWYEFKTEIWGDDPGALMGMPAMVKHHTDPIPGTYYIIFPDMDNPTEYAMYERDFNKYFLSLLDYRNNKINNLRNEN
jgi:hypothetical protein